MFVVPATSPWWSTVLRREIPGSAEEESESPSPGPNAEDAPEPVIPGSTLKVILHTRLPDAPGLGAVEREIPYVRGIVPQIWAAVSELGVASVDAEALLPGATRVLDVAYSQGGTVYIDFSSELDLGRDVGAEEEKVLIQGIVTTIADNFSAVRRIVILVDGRVPKPGHLDLTRALRRDDPIFAAEEEPEPQTMPTGAAVAAPPSPPAQAPPKAPRTTPTANPTATMPVR